MQSFRGPIALVCKAVGRTPSTEVGVRRGELHRVTAQCAVHTSVLGGSPPAAALAGSALATTLAGSALAATLAGSHAAASDRLASPPTLSQSHQY